MKSKMLLPITALLLFGNLIVSCDSCNKKNASDSSAVSYTDSTATATESNADTTVVANANETPTPASAATSTSTKTKTSKSDSKAKGASKDGYSAPDGTDAENHDGDQYTRNDATPKPTGPPIK